jgi:hypothetical protein
METKPISPDQRRNAIFAVVALALAALSYGLWHKLSADQEKEIAALEQRISELNTRLTALTAAPAPTVDTTATDQLRTDLTAAQATVTQLTARVTALEAKPTAPTPVAHAGTEPSSTEEATSETTQALVIAVRSGAPYNEEFASWSKQHAASVKHAKHLRDATMVGIPTEVVLRDRLRSLTLLAESTAAPEEGWIGKMNTHLAGLVSIRKQTAESNDIASLRGMIDTASIAELENHVDALPAARQATFAPWLAAAKTRDAALAELSALAAEDSAP